MNDFKPSYRDRKPPYRSQSPMPPRKRLTYRDGTPLGSEEWLSPWVELKYFSYNPAVFPRMIGSISGDAAPGQLVHVYDKNGEL
ncbi:MAG: class I SAM-dependent rRNA methyltransferase, partial [Akkermansia sp.]